MDFIDQAIEGSGGIDIDGIAHVLTQVDIGGHEGPRSGRLRTVQHAIDVKLAGSVRQAHARHMVPDSIIDGLVGSEIEPELTVTKSGPAQFTRRIEEPTTHA